MNFSDLSSAINSGAAAVNALSGSANAAVPGTTSLPAAEGRPISSGGGAAGAGITFGGAVVIYFLLKWTGLLPRWARII